jgi:hypothetical protein
MMALRFVCMAAFAVSSALAVCDVAVPDLSYKISGTNMVFPCDSTKGIYISSGRYVPKNVIGTRMQIYKDEAFIALPRYRHGVPFTLAKFSLKTKGCQAKLTPFPCWSMQEEGNCEALQSVVDIFIDQSEILWVLDIGLVNTLEQPVRRCPPKIIGINLKTGQVIKVIDLSKLVVPSSRLQYLVVDYTCDGRPFVYVADGGAGAIIVYDVFGGKGYRVVLPSSVTQTQRDVLYMVLIRRQCGNYVYFSYLSSPKMFNIKSELLQKGKTAGAIVEVGSKPEGVKGVILGTDNAAGMFFRFVGESDVYIWNTDTCFKSENFILVQRGNDCRLPTHVVPGYKRLMWSIESNFHDYIANTAGCLGPNMVVHPLIKTADDE